MGDPSNADLFSSTVNVDADHDGEFSATVLNYIDQMLMDEDTDEEEKYNLFHDSSALQATEKSFYDVISDKYPSSSSYSSSMQQHQIHTTYPNVESPEDDTTTTTTTTTSSGSSSSAESQLRILDPYAEYNPSAMPTPFPCPPPPNFVSQSYINPSSHFTPTATNSGLLENIAAPLFPSFNSSQQAVIKTEFDDEEEHFLEAEQEQDYGRSDTSNQYYSAVNNDDDVGELSELFDKVLLGTGLGKASLDGNGKNRIRKHDSYNEGIVDLRTLLLQCAQAISCDNRSFANELLMQIRKHSSSTGDGTQRLAHCFANALEARIAGTGTCVFRALSSKGTSPADMVKAYRVYASACPFEKIAIMFANNSIFDVAKGVETLHVVDFGIRYGFKWPALISRLSRREGGPPKLRITGIELPLPGLKLEETGRCLAMYCKRFNVPFEFNAIVAKKWETIKVEDLNIKEKECVAVNCMFRFENLLDETVVSLSNNPRDAVLGLIRRANPSIFVHGIVNGSYDAAFFVTRFKEALFHYSALFDMLDTNVGRDDAIRLVFEEQFFGREVVNVIACEDCERVVRPHNYKKWHVRNKRCGFREVPMDQRIVDKLKRRLRDDRDHSDFMLHVDGNWVLQGWKGRILHASSSWVPA